MSVKEVERIKELISKAELENAKIQGTIESIESEWKDDYGVETVEQAVEKLNELEEEKKSSDLRLDKLKNELESSYDWDDLEEELGA